MNKKIVICGSFSDTNSFLIEVRRLRSLGYDVFPDENHLKESQPCIDAHHRGKGDTSETLQLRKKLMQRYFDKIRDCDEIYVFNVKNDYEHIGIGTSLEIGYALALGKTIRFHKIPTDANIKSYFISDNTKKEEVGV